MLAAIPGAAAALPKADAPTLDLYVGDERQTTITTTNFGTATEALAAAVLAARSAANCFMAEFIAVVLID